MTEENSMDDMFPSNPLSVAQEAAASLHELFLCYVAAGFTAPQAIELIKSILQSAVQNGIGNANT